MEMENLPRDIADSPIQMASPKPNLVPIGSLILPRVVKIQPQTSNTKKKETMSSPLSGIGAVQILTSLCVVGVLVGVIFISKK